MTHCCNNDLLLHKGASAFTSYFATLNLNVEVLFILDFCEMLLPADVIASPKRSGLVFSPRRTEDSSTPSPHSTVQLCKYATQLEHVRKSFY